MPKLHWPEYQLRQEYPSPYSCQLRKCIAPCISVLQCKLESLPLSYLCLPLSTTKIKSSTHNTLLPKSGRFLSGWSSLLLFFDKESFILKVTKSDTSMELSSPEPGRSNGPCQLRAVLSSQLIYAMSALLIPPCGIVRKVDSRRGAFLWNGCDN